MVMVPAVKVHEEYLPSNVKLSSRCDNSRHALQVN